MAQPRRHLKIYRSRLHLAITLSFIFLPFVFFFFFSVVTHIGAVSLFNDIYISFIRIFLAYIAATALAWLFAVLFYRGVRGTVALPIFDVLQSFPTFAALPLATYFLGPSNTTVIIFLIITIIWPIFFTTISSLKSIQRDWQDVADIYGLSEWQYIRHFIWPISVPGLITGSIIGLGEGWEALVATELIVGVHSGLGSFFGLFSKNPTVTTFGILGLLLLIFSMNTLIWLPLLEKSHRMMEE